jgi:4-hydroxybenzoyl-CoA thioesterase
MAFEFPQKVLFKHCDPAGIVFYPRHFEMVNDCVEAFFAEVLDWPFESIHGSAGVPTVHVETDFIAMCRHGDALVLRLAGENLGRTSLRLCIESRAGDELRMRTRLTLVHVVDGRAQPWPEAPRARLEDFMKGRT